MAEAIRKRDCSICLDEFKTPKILPCIHTFCEGCLRQHIETHAHFNKFNCPVCRREIEVPVGGASGFTRNFWLDEPNPSLINYCTIHKAKEIEFYCRDCCVAACSNCVIINHTTHTKVDLTDVEKEYRTKVTASKETLEKKIQQLKLDQKLLQLKSDSITTSAVTACTNIDTRVEEIYAEAKKIGAKLKGDANQLCVVEVEKLQKLMCDKVSLIAQLETAVDCSNKSLTGTSTKSLIDISPYVQTLSEDSENLSTDVPVVKHSYFPLVEINTDLLKTQIGELQTIDESTFTASFNLENINKKDVLYYSDDYIIQGLPWCVCVKHETETSTLGIYLYLKKGEDVTAISCTADRTIKLLHPTDDSKSVVRKDTGFVYKSGGTGWGFDFIDWKKLIDPTNGFLHNNRFTVQTTVKITNIET